MAIKKLVQHDGRLAFLRVSEWLYFLRGVSCCQVAVVNIFSMSTGLCCLSC